MATMCDSTRQSTSGAARLRQVALIVSDLAAAENILHMVLGTEVVFRDPEVARWGLSNFLAPLGGDLIEVVSPFRDGTTAGRLLAKRGEGGYMIIMQTLDAAAQRQHVESCDLAKVIFSFSKEDVDCVQYHPKGIPGGMMPELDSHTPSRENPEPLTSRFSPWHACGPDFQGYAAAMARSSHFQLLGVTCRLASGDKDTEGAARKWEQTFGVIRDGSELVFTNARLRFLEGVKNVSDGLESITVGLHGKALYDQVHRTAREQQVEKGGQVLMLGVKWHFVLLDSKEIKSVM
ncbi:hypothetical protein BJY01DRAFT_237122 [Aspergillus pseudoustus]|uniref:Glyoxalase-like domain-containing protein n=1 Tax=Aspergillus pseudoustus TaxID=1810923 RepID=A0ABR4JIM3_9EURO